MESAMRCVVFRCGGTRFRSGSARMDAGRCVTFPRMDTTTAIALLDHPWLQLAYFGNSVRAYLYSLAFIAVGIAFIIILDRVVLRRMLKLTERTRAGFDDFLIMSLKRHGVPALYAVIFYLGVRDLEMRDAVAKVFQIGMYLWIAFNGVRFLTSLVQKLLENHMESRADSPVVAEQEKKSVKGILAFIKLVLWALAFILVLDNLGIKVSAFVAGLGIGGIAIALAAQAVLGDLFSYFVIFFDRPFQVGHFIKIGNFMGEVESIGIKTTRIRSLTGETIVMSNKYLTDNQVQNYRLMTRRRMTVIFDVEYGSTDAQLRAIPATVKAILEPMEKVTFDRCHFKEFAESGLRYELIYFVEAPEMLLAMDIQQELNFQLKEKLEAQGLAFALPTRTLHVVPPAGAAPGVAMGAPQPVPGATPPVPGAGA